MIFPPDPDIGRRIYLFHAAIFLSGAAIIVALAVAVFLRQPPADEPPTARTRLYAGTRLRPGDLATKDILALEGRFLADTVEAGKPVTASITSAVALPLTPQNTLAVLITMGNASRDRPEFDLSDRVDIVRGADKLATGTVLVRGCTKTDCTYLVAPDQTSAIERIIFDGATLRKRRTVLPAPSGTGE